MSAYIRLLQIQDLFLYMDALWLIREKTSEGNGKYELILILHCSAILHICMSTYTRLIEIQELFLYMDAFCMSSPWLGAIQSFQFYCQMFQKDIFLYMDAGCIPNVGQEYWKILLNTKCKEPFICSSSMHYKCSVLNVIILCRITFTPTIQHCSMATVIGLCLREKLKNCFPPHYKVVFWTSHINWQLSIVSFYFIFSYRDRLINHNAALYCSAVSVL